MLPPTINNEARARDFVSERERKAVSTETWGDQSELASFKLSQTFSNGPSMCRAYSEEVRVRLGACCSTATCTRETKQSANRRTKAKVPDIGADRDREVTSASPFMVRVSPSLTGISRSAFACAPFPLRPPAFFPLRPAASSLGALSGAALAAHTSRQAAVPRACASQILHSHKFSTGRNGRGFHSTECHQHRASGSH